MELSEVAQASMTVIEQLVLKSNLLEEELIRETDDVKRKQIENELGRILNASQVVMSLAFDKKEIEPKIEKTNKYTPSVSLMWTKRYHT